MIGFSETKLHFQYSFKKIPPETEIIKYTSQPM